MNLLIDTHLLLWAAAWPDRLPAEARQRVKDERGRQHQRESMRGKEPTPAQLRLLDRLGITDPPADRLQASELIDALLGERRRGGGRGGGKRPLGAAP